MLHPYFSKFSNESLRTQYQANITQLEEMRKKVKQTGKKINGFTEDDLTDLIAKLSKNLSDLPQ